MSTPACAQTLDLADRHAVHALHHDHVGVHRVPDHLGNQHQVQARPCCGAAARRWRPRAPGRARRAGSCRTRPPPRAASGACRRRTAARPSAPACAAARRSSRSTRSMPGRSTFTATSRPASQHRESAPARSRRWPPARRRSWRRSRRSGAGTRARPSRSRLLARERRHAVLQLGQLVGHVGRQQVAPGRQHLAELDEDRAQTLERLAQARATRLVEAAPDGDHARQPRTQRWRNPDERHLVHAEAQQREGDERRRRPDAS